MSGGGGFRRRFPLPPTPGAEQTMSMPASTTRRWTAAEVRALPEVPGKRFEVVDGELLVSPGPAWSHQRLAFELMKRLDEHVTAHGIGIVLNGPADIEPDPCSMVQPDAFVVPLVDGRPPRDWGEVGRVLLVAEVLSPGTARHDRVVKRRLYRRMGVEYWIVDPDARCVERWLPGAALASVEDERLEWIPDGTGAPLAVDLIALFARVLGDT